jgi:hypothetical protein
LTRTIGDLGRTPFQTEAWSTVAESVDRAALARSAVIIVGPESLLKVATEVTDLCGEAFDHLSTLDRGPAGVEPGNFDARKKFAGRLHDFTVECQRVLGTKD